MIIREISDILRFRKGGIDKKRALTFYARNAVDHQYLEPIYREVIQNSDIHIYYITSDSKDPIHRSALPQFTPLYGKSLLSYFTPFIDTQGVVMTKPALGQDSFKRSGQGAHHFYVFHTIMSTHMVYPKSAFDSFETVFCVGEFQKREIRKHEEIEGLPPKEIVEAGYPVLDKIYQRFQAGKKKSSPKNLCVIAPTWSRGNIMDTCVIRLVRSLLEAQCDVIVRPHPEYARMAASKLKTIQTELSYHKGVQFEIDATDSQSLYDAEVLITDWSGIAMEFAFGMERPVLFVETPRKINNPEYESLEIEPLEVRIRHQIGKELPLHAAYQAGLHVRELLDERDKYAETIRSIRAESVYALGESASRYARHLIDFCDNAVSRQSSGNCS